MPPCILGITAASSVALALVGTFALCSRSRLAAVPMLVLLLLMMLLVVGVVALLLLELNRMRKSMKRRGNG